MRGAPGTLQVTLTANDLPATSDNRIASVSFDRLDNATVSVTGGPDGQRQPFAYAAASPLPQVVVFTVTRTTAGQATTVRLRVVDACGVWTTFVGGGPSGF